VGKRMAVAEKDIEAGKKYSLEQAVALVKKNATAKFDETVELHVRLGIDPKKSDQTVRGIVVMPHGIGKTKRVVVLAKGEKQKEASAAGADETGDAELIEKISKGWMDFDVLVATPDAMKDLARVAKILGPKGLMPNPKAGTVTFDVGRTVKELKAGRIEFKADDYGIVHAVVGKKSFPEKNLLENAETLLHALQSARPATAKGAYMRSVTLCSTMGPGVSVLPEAPAPK
jgi:large subunit ribosomal protein L1